MTIGQAASNLFRKRQGRRAAGARQLAQFTVDPPTGGWNTRDDFSAQTNRKEAIELINLVPSHHGVLIREGFKLIGELVATGSRRLLRHSSAGKQIILNASNTVLQAWIDGPATGTPATKTGLHSSDWSATMMQNSLALVNGLDKELIFDGIEFKDMVLSGQGTAVMWGVKVFKSRSYFWEKNRLGFWYSSVNALGGAVTYFPLQGVAQYGGSIVSINSWTRDGGSGVDDFMVVTTDRGELLVYQGSNPGNLADWGLIGIYTIPSPINKHCFLELDGSLHIATKSDYMIFPERINQFNQPSRISGALAAAYKAKSSYPHWNLNYDPIRKWIILNVPHSGNKAHQYVRSTSGWTMFTGMDANDFMEVNDELYFISSNVSRIYKVGGTNSIVPTDKNLLTSPDAFDTWTPFGAAVVTPDNLSIENPVNGQFTADELDLVGTGAADGIEFDVTSVTTGGITERYVFSVYAYGLSGEGRMFLSFWSDTGGDFSSTTEVITQGVWTRRYSEGFWPLASTVRKIRILGASQNPRETILLSSVMLEPGSVLTDFSTKAAPVAWKCKTAYHSLGTNRNKHIKGYRPVWTYNGDFSLTTSLAYDYSEQYLDAQSLATPAINTTDWNEYSASVVLWNEYATNGTQWNKPNRTKNEWFGGGGQGQVVSLSMSGESMVAGSWKHADYKFDAGAAL